MTWGVCLNLSGHHFLTCRMGIIKAISPWSWGDHILMNQKAFAHLLSCHERHTNPEKETREAELEGQKRPGSKPSPASCVTGGESLCLGFYFPTQEEEGRDLGRALQPATIQHTLMTSSLHGARPAALLGVS